MKEAGQTVPQVDDIVVRVEKLASEFEATRAERLRRTALDPEDFGRLAETGYPLLPVPRAHGGCFEGVASAIRPISRALRSLAGADPCLALVSAMHPGVLSFWAVQQGEPPPECRDAWQRQCETLFGHVRDGAWFGTIASEPGAGGDLHATKCIASPLSNGRYALSGQKFMGSGSGVTSFMLTVAKVPGEDEPEVFMLDCRNRPWDGTTGMRLTREWDGAGMAATQSHAFHFDGAEIERYAWPGRALEVTPVTLTIVINTFCAVALGILDAAMREAGLVMARKGSRARPLEQSEWTLANNDYWLCCQAFEASLTATETDRASIMAARQAKFAIARLADRIFERLGRALGGMALSTSTPFAQWSLDIKALGHLRPPWALAQDQLFEATLTDDAQPA